MDPERRQAILKLIQQQPSYMHLKKREIITKDRYRSAI
jgi:hypothetical protein